MRTAAPRHARLAVDAVLVAIALLAVTRPAAERVRADPLEPPPEAPEGADYEIEPADSLESGSVELGFAASGRGGSATRRGERVRFAAEDLSGTVRDGAGDPLAGGSVENRAGFGAFTVGRLAPRWGRGLVIGSPGDPWQRAALDRGSRSAFRGRAGEGVLVSSGDRVGLDALLGRFARRDLGGARGRVGPVALGVLAARGGPSQSSLALSGPAGEGELAMDAARRWRMETLLERPLGGWIVSARARGGRADFRSLAEPRRNGPARAVALGAGGVSPLGDLGVLACAWAFRPGITGSRLSLTLQRPLARAALLRAGFDEQHGTRRETGASGGDRFRQGLWGEWRSAPGPLALALHHEVWGARPWARAAVRVVTTVRLEARLPFEAGVRITHSAFRVRRGESVYLPEPESDRLVLRALSGEGARTRIEALVPGAQGRLHASLALARAPGRPITPQWSLDWTRRSRSRRSRARPRRSRIRHDGDDRARSPALGAAAVSGLRHRSWRSPGRCAAQPAPSGTPAAT